MDPSGIRLGTPALTTRGLAEEHMPAVAAWMDAAVDGRWPRTTRRGLDRIAGEVAELLSGFPMPGWAPTP